MATCCEFVLKNTSTPGVAKAKIKNCNKHAQLISSCSAARLLKRYIRLSSLHTPRYNARELNLINDRKIPVDRTHSCLILCCFHLAMQVSATRFFAVYFVNNFALDIRVRCAPETQGKYYLRYNLLGILSN